jgi:hypothetical protein
LAKALCDRPRASRAATIGWPDKARADAAKKAAANNVKETAAAKSASPQSLDDQLRQIYRKGRG